jgi:hypothetical protein
MHARPKNPSRRSARVETGQRFQVTKVGAHRRDRRLNPGGRRRQYDAGAGIVTRWEPTGEGQGDARDGDPGG